MFEYHIIYTDDGVSFLNLRFENDVKMYGIQTSFCLCVCQEQFENDVKIYNLKANM